MKNQDFNINELNEDIDMPQWLASVLRLAGDEAAFETSNFAVPEISESFRLRCHQAVEEALIILKLRRERQRIGFLAVSLVDYLQGLIKVADIVPSQVPALLIDIANRLQTPEYLSSIGHLTKKIGMSLQETLAHLRIGFAAQHQLASMTLLVAHRQAGDPRRSQLENCEAVLSQIEAGYDARSLRDLRAIEQALRKTYEEGDNNPA